MCDHALVAATVFAEQQAQLFGLDEARRAFGFAVRDEGVDDVAREPLLVREAMPDGVDEARDATEAVQSAAGQIRDVRHSSERYEVVRADAVHRDAANDDDVFARIGEAVAEDVGEVLSVATEQSLLPERPDT